MHDYQPSPPQPEGSPDETPRSSIVDENTIPHGEIGAPAAELARNLPELVEHLHRLRLEMEKCNKIYEAINLGARASKAAAGEDLGENEGNPAPLLSKIGSSRSLYDGVPEENDPTMSGNYNANGLMNSLRRSQTPPKLQPRMSARMSAMLQNVHYTVMWVSGECGISLRNFSSNKIGAQIAVLQQADGVTTGISNCRLGDQLMTVNDDRVEEMRFKDIVQKLKSTRRPITLGFRTNQNLSTSPTASSSRPTSTTSSSRNFFGTNDFDDFVTSSTTAAMESAADRQTYSSMRSSTSTLSDDVEIFCREQEEMHSDIILLLTETVLRCEKLQQENHDQLQSLMQLAPNVQSSMNPSPKSVRALSSLAPVASPAAAVKLLEELPSQRGETISSA